MTTTSDTLVDPDLHDLIISVVSSHVAADDRRLWSHLAELGLADLTGSEQRGGSAASWHEAAVLVRTLSAHGRTLDIGQSDLVAGWLLDRANVVAPQALRIIHVLDAKAPSTAESVPEYVERVVVLRPEGSRWALADIASADLADPAAPSETVWYPLDSDVVEQAKLRLALVRAVQITGVLDTITALAIEHAQTRAQFGRPIGNRQAVQHLVTVIAGETALALAATDAAVLVAAEPDVTTERLAPMVAVARSCAGHAVDPVVRNAHQVIGAIGTTREHRLHTFTSAAMALRNEEGTTRDWDRTVLDLALHRHALSDLSLAPTAVLI